MKHLSTLSLSLILSLPAAADNTLVYSVTEEPKSQQVITKITEDLVKELFRDSGYNLRSRILPVGVRTLSELTQHRLDIGFTGFNKDTMPLLAGDAFEIHPLPIASVSTNYYALRSSGLTAETIDYLSDYRLGMVRTSKHTVEAVLGKKPGPVTYFSSHHNLSKGLAAGRIDIMLSDPSMTSHNLKMLGIEGAVVSLGQAFTTDFHLVVRASLPATTKRAIFDLMDQRIPEFKRQNKLREILAKHGWE